ncbi:hypothetical protein FRC04_002733 [Tulasnella sp. 424]|nr:hypothetical protein FRC04_002733 [Tulasnella sp. 424]KAG8974237.1 hypothetical protein FRC05_007813 [Tulasnella sp. 425]
MDIFNRPPTIAEDTVIYSIYPPPGTNQTEAAALSALITSYVQDSLLPANHIWHRDSFELHLVERDGTSSRRLVTPEQLRLEGTMRVGDAVDDECVYDNDGEFLLIEAAQHLPNWVTPENAENRVWIYQSNLHLVPLEHISPPSASSKTSRRKLPRHEDADTEKDVPDEADFITIEHALRLIRDTDIDTKATDQIQGAIRRRIRGYPNTLKQHVHRTRAYLPEDIVLALSQDPALIQKAVEAFYTRDALQLRVVSKMSRFPPNTSKYAPVTMTRTAYAQLMGQKFHPPKVFGRWTESEGTAEWRWKDIGMKVACGFEMLYSENKSRAGSASSSGPESIEALKDALGRDAGYQSYIENLKRAGWFPVGEIEGSEAWKEKENKAATAWVAVRKEDNANRATFTALVDMALSRAQARKAEILSSTSSDTTAEDSDEWLNVSPEDLDNALAEAGGLPNAEGSAMDVGGDMQQQLDGEAKAQEQAKKLGKLAKKVEAFVEGHGDLDGAVFDDDDISDDGGADDLSLSDPSSSSDEDDRKPTAAERQRAMDALVAPLDPDEYGKLPAMEVPPPASGVTGSKKSASQKTAPVTMETETRTLPNGEIRKIRKPILMRDKFDGVDSDDESTSDEGEGEEEDARRAANAWREVGDESDDEAPQVVGGISHDIDINMEDEEEEFLKFSRDALGISEEQWTAILDERKGRGAFVPSPKASRTSHTAPAQDQAPPKLSSGLEAGLKKKTNKFLSAIAADDHPASSPATSPSTTQPGPPRERRSKPPPTGPRNPDLDSFEAVMAAMDAELQKSRQARQNAKGRATTASTTSSPVSSAQDKGKGKAKDVEEEDDQPSNDEDDDVDAQMDAELRAALRSADADEGGNDSEVEEAGMDYNLMKNFLESFRSQAGLSGPVSNLAGRLEPGWTLPRDES